MTHTDPVCGMKVDDKTAAAKINFNGEDLYFCSKQCADKFKEDPQQYVSSAA